MKNKFSLAKKIGQLFSVKKNKEEILEELEELLILADISGELVTRLLANIKKKSGIFFAKEDFLSLLKEELRQIFNNISSGEIVLTGDKNIILLVGINGSGKTTSAAKLAYYLSNRGKKILFAAADTFRAAGSTQLLLWGKKLNIPVISGDMGADPGSVVFNSLSSFKSRDYDVLIIDTAGRVQTRDLLMKELEKIIKIIKKIFPDQPAETLLTIDATMGQNTLDQARKFKEFTDLSGIILAKLDGTAKGGTIINILDQLKLPVKFGGTGEKEQDLEEFSIPDFIESLLTDG